MNPTVEAYEAMTRGTDCVKMMTLAPELPGALDMIAIISGKRASSPARRIPTRRRKTCTPRRTGA